MMYSLMVFPLLTAASLTCLCTSSGTLMLMLTIENLRDEIPDGLLLENGRQLQSLVELIRYLYIDVDHGKLHNLSMCT